MEVTLKLIVVTFLLPFILAQTSTRTNVRLQEPNRNDVFASVRSQSKIYVDKTSYINKLIESEERFFIMCRPGRFGKSNFLLTLKSFFEGRKELFEGLKIYTKHDWGTTYPVIYIDLNGKNSLVDLYTSLLRTIADTAKSYGIERDKKLPIFMFNTSDVRDTMFGHLIDQLTQYGKRQIVVLIDEYDWPLRQNSPRSSSSFHSYFPYRQEISHKFIIPVLHLFERYKDRIKLFLVTCTVKMNYTTNAECPIPPLKDITFDPQFSEMIGLTEAELKRNFKPHIKAMISQPAEETFLSIVEKLKKRYNGYSFAGNTRKKCGLFNFHSVLSCLRNKNADYRWHPAANPKYNIIDDYSISEIEDASSWFEKILTTDTFEVSRKALETEAHQTYGYDKIPMVVSMVLHGYLMFRDFDKKTDRFIVAFPNDEIRESYRRALLKIIHGRDLPSHQFVDMCKNLFDSMQVEGRAASFIEQLNSLTFTSYEDNVTHAEDWLQRYSAERIVAIFRVCQLSVKNSFTTPYSNLSVEYSKKIFNNEKHEFTHDGLKVTLPSQCSYWIHFDFNRSAPSAMNMLLRKVSNKDVPSVGLSVSRDQPIYLMGVNFNERNDMVEEWIRMTYSCGKCEDLQASHPMYLKMFSYLTDVEAYSSLP